MTADKDFKRLVRARAKRTGESYSVARAGLLAEGKDPPAMCEIRNERGEKMTVDPIEGVELAINMATEKAGGHPGLPPGAQLLIHQISDGTKLATVHVGEDGGLHIWRTRQYPVWGPR